MSIGCNDAPNMNFNSLNDIVFPQYRKKCTAYCLCHDMDMYHDTDIDTDTYIQHILGKKLCGRICRVSPCRGN